MLKKLLSLLFLICAMNAYSAEELDLHGKVYFFGIGHAHCTLVTQNDKIPLLIDVGHPRVLPFSFKHNFTWGKEDIASMVSRIEKKISSFWRSKNELLPPDQETYDLVVFISHADEDHYGGLIPLLDKLNEVVQTERRNTTSKFKPYVFLGGLWKDYKKLQISGNELLRRSYMMDYSVPDQPVPNGLMLGKGHLPPRSSYKDIVLEHNLEGILEHLKLEKGSLPITHLIYPVYSNDNINRWSFLIRISVKSKDDTLSALITGDNEGLNESNKEIFLHSLNKLPQDFIAQLQSDIMLMPHHGGERVPGLINLIKPQQFVFMTGPHDSYLHPRAECVIDFIHPHMYPVTKHGVLINGTRQHIQHIQEHITQEDSLTEIHPQSEYGRDWRLFWTTLPFYTTWTTGTLRFKAGEISPKYVDTKKTGMMPYIAMPVDDNDPVDLNQSDYFEIPNVILPRSIEESEILTSELDDEEFDRAKTESTKDAVESHKIGPRELPDSGWVFQDVRDHGNCFYDAVALQDGIINHQSLHDRSLGTELCDILRLRVQGEKFKDREWADQMQIDEFVREFDVILAVVDTRRPEVGFTYYFLDAENNLRTKAPTADIPLPQGKTIVKIATTGNHFLSVLEHP